MIKATDNFISHITRSVEIMVPVSIIIMLILMA